MTPALVSNGARASLVPEVTLAGGPCPVCAWPRLRIGLRNTRNAFAREHPLWIFKAIFLHALRAAGIERRPFAFHPLSEPTGERVRLGSHYGLEVVFPGWPLDDAARFHEGLARHLADPRFNFELEPGPGPEIRTLAQAIEHAEERTRTDDGELCLDFLTPLAFSGSESGPDGVRWRLDPAILLALVERRIAELGLAPMPLRLREAFLQLEILSHLWTFHRHAHRPKTPSGQGGSDRQEILGMQGPVYLRGPWREIMPALVLMSELHFGNRINNGCGRFILRVHRTCLDRDLAEPARYVAAARELRAASDAMDEFAGAVPGAQAVARLAADLAAGRHQPAPAHIFSIPKPSGGHRVLAELKPADRVAHRALHTLLSERLDRLLDPGAIGFRPGQSTGTARKLLTAAMRDGFTHALETDIAAFFDEVDWKLMDRALDRFLPRADTAIRHALKCAIRTPAEQDGLPVQRQRGLLQGSALSPLLANLYLDGFDHAIRREGWRLIRYADDFIVLARGQEDARRAQAFAEARLAELGLRLKPEKTAIAAIRDGIDFLGLRLDDDLAESWVEQVSLKKPVYIGDLHAFAGLDGETLVVRRGKELLARLPLYRIGQIVIQGGNTLSTRLIQECSHRNIPVAICSLSGSHVNTIWPQSRRQWQRAAAHAARHAGLNDTATLAIARRIVAAKIANYATWLDCLQDPGIMTALEEVHRIRDFLDGPDPLESVESLRGYEGRAARVLFGAINSLVRQPEFKSAARKPREKTDRWNVALDFAYFLLFTRIDVLLRGRGLNPWLGFLHSPGDPFESLVCDLQEPFRARIDRFVLRAVNRGIIKAADFVQLPDGRWKFAGEAAGRFFEAFEREMATCLGSDPASLRRMIAGQVTAVSAWVEKGVDLFFHRNIAQGNPTGEEAGTTTAVEAEADDLEEEPYA